MLCLTDIMRDHEPSLQPLLHAVAKAPTLTAMLVAVWPLARVLALQVVAAVLQERAGRPTSWPPCPVCGTRLVSKGFVERRVTSLFGRLRWRRAMDCTFQWLNRRGGKRRNVTWEQFTQLLDRMKIARPCLTEVRRRRVVA